MAILTTDLSASFSVEAQVAFSERRNFDRADSDLVMFQTVGVVAEQVPTLLGRGVKPRLWARCTPHLSSTGERFSGNRPQQGEVIVESDVAWLPFEADWDVTTGIWTPYRSNQPDWYWDSDLLTAPVREQFTYSIEREIITVETFRLSDNQFFYSQFGPSDAINWTFSMVLLLEPPLDAPYAVLDWGIPGWTDQTPPPQRPYIHAGEDLHFGWNGWNGIVDPIDPLSRYRPCFVTMVVSPPLVQVYLSTGGNMTLSSWAGQGEVVSTPMQFFLGKSTDLALEEGDFRVMEINIWERALANNEIIVLNSQYASVYGAAHARR